jgi:hypothetical protein
LSRPWRPMSECAHSVTQRYDVAAKGTMAFSRGLASRYQERP